MERTCRRLVGSSLAAVLVFAALTAPAALAAGGNNGTVKIQEGALNAEPVTQNEPNVCTFHMLFLFADAGQSGSWSIDRQAPVVDGSTEWVDLQQSVGGPTGLSDTYLTGANGQYATVEYGLPVGHYTLNWEGRNDQNVKHKTFWVTCANLPGPIGEGGGIG